MKPGFICIFILSISLPACGSSKLISSPVQFPTNVQNTLVIETETPEITKVFDTLDAIPLFTPLTEPCSTPLPDELLDFINRAITFADNGKTFFTHVTSRFWIYLDDRIYSLRDLLNSIPSGLIGYISNGSIRGPQCYPIMFEAVHEGNGVIKLKDFHLSLIVNNNVPESSLPLH
jgi:hypothetical protein